MGVCCRPTQSKLRTLPQLAMISVIATDGYIFSLAASRLLPMLRRNSFISPNRQGRISSSRKINR